MTEKDERQAMLEGIRRELHKYINATPELLSLLYDLDLMPEQLEVGSKDYNRMLVLAQWHECFRRKANDP